MNLVKVKTKFQVTLPTYIRKQARLAIGDILEAKVEKGKITLEPQSLIDRRLAESLEDIRQGRVHGPFKSADDAIVFLHNRVKEYKKIKINRRG